MFAKTLSLHTFFIDPNRLARGAYKEAVIGAPRDEHKHKTHRSDFKKKPFYFTRRLLL
jgi:hypothetical protein